ncbi:MAG: hypothetical protein O7C58_08020 [Rickettsia endosymbiont of Ixodes persulcatus]|nr:hypothetical protein [Rickettsia endosymbiont of Ixodes persulcatus]MCZ6909641.1 hypothetical protein [Rickettsia endosymbiont of Ixodes persulcatus]
MLIAAYLALPSSKNLEVFNTILAKHNFDKLSPNKFKNDLSKSQLYYEVQALQYTYNVQLELAYSAYDKIRSFALSKIAYQLEAI